MPDIEIVKLDQGGANARILAREAKVDFRRVEAASVKMATRFTSAEGKRVVGEHLSSVERDEGERIRTVGELRQ